MKTRAIMNCLMVLTCLMLVIQVDRSSSMLLGGLEDLNTDDKETMQKVDKLIDFALDSIAAKRMEELKSGDEPVRPLKYSMTGFISGKTQLVAGVNYFLKIEMKSAECENKCEEEMCDLTIYEVAWLNKTELTDFKCKTKDRRLFGGRNSDEDKKPHLIGGLNDLDMNDDETMKKVDELIDFALDSIATKRMEELKTGDEPVKPLEYSLIRFISGKTQLVSGINYFLKIKMKEAQCKRSCEIEMCDVTIYHVPWLNTTELTDFKCKKRNRHLLGGRMTIDSNDENARQAVGFSVDQYNKKSNSLYFHRLVKLNNVQRQIVNGISYSLDFTMGRTGCMKNQMKLLDYSRCPLDDSVTSDDHMTCTSTVLDRPWNNSGSRYQLIREIKCSSKASSN